MLVSTSDAEGVKVDLGSAKLTFKFLASKGAKGDPQPRVEGDRVVIGKQTVSLRDGGLVLGNMSTELKSLIKEKIR